MKRNNFYCLILLGFILVLTIQSFAQEELRIYSAPEGEAVSDLYAVTINGKPIDIYAAQSEYFEGDYYFASFDFSGKVEIQITSKSMSDQAVILPKSFGLQPDINGNSMTFEADKPFRVSIEPQNRIKPLLLFGNALETDIPDPNDSQVVYFGPGIHRPGKISLTDNQTLYLAGGAVVKGSVQASGKNIKICGRGMLAGEESPRFNGPGRFLLDCQNCEKLVVSDIILRNPWSWTFVTWNCVDVLIDGVKICGSRMINDDALDLVNTENVIVRNCFFRTQDDSIAIKGLANMTRPCQNIRIENCQFWTDLANIFRIGYECETSGMRDIYAKNIDVLHYSINWREPTQYWANTIIWLQPNQDMLMENCYFEKITVYSDGSDMLMLMAKPMRCQYGENQNPEPGALRHCFFKDIQVVGNPGNFSGLIYLLGENDKHNVEDMFFEGINYFGRSITQNDECVQIGPYVQNVEFRP
ncbi:MAG: glycosyl hydrolase family 28 protein [Planctomycetia bacterium]|nr:glycosyl hydrolase family 28 protein [Planctomycetia bacterium]